MNTKIALTNATGRQSASLARSASAVGYHIAAHITSSKYSPLVASEIAALPDTTIHNGQLSSLDLQAALFKGADIAFINTTSFDNELEVGKACADAAKKAGVKYIIYSSMPDHGAAEQAESKGWHGLPQYRDKWKVEEYIRTLNIQATYVYTGIYYNNFTSLPYPLFCLREVPWQEVEEWEGDWQDDWVEEKDGEETKGKKCGFEWQAPFPPDAKLPWLDTEHDFGPAVLQIFIDGPEKWGGKRVPLAFDLLDPPSVCAAFSRGLNRPVRYVEGPIEVTVPIPRGYHEQLDALQDLFGGTVVKGKNAPYWWDGIFDSDKNGKIKHVSGLVEGEVPDEVEQDARISRALWEGWRDIEGYARDTFPVEERLNGLSWMDDESE